MAELDKNISQEEENEFKASIYYKLNRIVMTAIIIVFASNALGIAVDIYKFGSSDDFSFSGFILFSVFCIFLFSIFSLPGAILTFLSRLIFQKLLYRKSRKTIALIITVISVAVSLQNIYYFGLHII